MDRWITAHGVATDRRRNPDLFVAAAVFALLVVLVTTEWALLLQADETVVQAVNDVVGDTPWMVRVLQALTDLGGAQVTWVAVPLMAAWLAIRRATRAAIYVAVSGLGAVVLDPALKAVVGRARPVVETPVATAPAASFPSGHALGATILYGLLLLVVLPAVPTRWRRPAAGAAVAIVAVVGLTRVALGVHHLTDVIAGWALGVVWLAVTNIAVLRRPTGRPEQGGAALHAAPRSERVLPHGARSVAVLLVAAVLLWGALLAIGELVSTPRGALLQFDVTVVQWLADVRTAWLSDLARLAGRFGGTAGVVGGVLVASVLALAITRRWRPALFPVVAVVGETAIFLGTATIVERSRPPVEFLTEHLPATASFPSGHVAAAAALYGAAAMLVVAWRRDWFGGLAVVGAVLLTLGVGLSRLYRGVHYPTDVIASLVFATVWLLVCWHVLQPGPPADAAAPAAPEGEVTVSRRAVQVVGAAVVGILVIGATYGVAVEPRLRLDERHYQTAIPGLPDELAGTTVAVFSDLQVGMWWANVGMVDRIVRRTVQARPDAVLIPGDFVYGRSPEVAEQVENVVALLAPLLDSGIPVFAVLGNHDYAAGAARELTTALEERGVAVLQNAAVPLAAAGEELWVVGIGSHRYGHSRPEVAFAGVPDDAARVVMMHNPVSFEEIGAHHAPLAVAGHTHCGQVSVPGTPAWSYLELTGRERLVVDGFAPPRYGAEGNRLFVTCGVGFSVMPVRILAPPQLVFFELVPPGT